MTILAIDTSSQWCSVALFHSPEVYWVSHQELGNSASQVLLPQVSELLKQAGLQLEDVSCFAVGQGPGAFTGIRLGVGVAQGLAFSQAKPLIPVTSLDGMIAKAWIDQCAITHSNSVVQVVIDARMQQVYQASYTCGEHEFPIRTSSIELKSPLEVFSDSVPTLQFHCEEYFLESTNEIHKNTYLTVTPHALGIAIVASRMDRTIPYLPENAQPLYIRDKVAQTTLERAQSNIGQA